MLAEYFYRVFFFIARHIIRLPFGSDFDKSDEYQAHYGKDFGWGHVAIRDCEVVFSYSVVFALGWLRIAAAGGTECCYLSGLYFIIPFYPQHSKVLGFEKGNYYWERQFGPYIVMWKHDEKYHSTDTRCIIRRGRLVIWWDSAWVPFEVTRRRARRAWLKRTKK
jgi:hypothetical protein